MRTIQVIIGFLLYAVIAGFLCMAAITNPNLTDTSQWIWCAVAVGWGPAIAVAIALLASVM